MNEVAEIIRSGRYVIVYPFVCYECGGHTRAGDRCSLCGGRGRRVVKPARRASSLAPTSP